MAKIPHRLYLTEDQMPKQWYNLRADMKEKPDPLIHPGTHQPLPEEALYPIFCQKLAHQELDNDTRYIDIPEPVLDMYKLYRPSPLCRAYNLEKALDTPAKIYYKFEGNNTSGSHKLNSAIAQAYYAKEQGLKGLTTETGAGQWGTALSEACAYFGLDLKVFMVKVSYEQKPFRKAIMQTFDANVTPSPSNTTEAGRAILAHDPTTGGSLGCAISEAVEVATTHEGYRYVLGSVLNQVLLHQSIIGLESKQAMEMLDEYPDIVIGCAGGGSNLGGLISPFMQDKLLGKADPRIIAVEPASCPSLHARQVRLRFLRYRPRYAAGPHVHARQRLHARAQPRRRPALPRHEPDPLQAVPRRLYGGGFRQADRRIRRSGSVCQGGDHSSGAGVQPRHPRRNRRSAQVQGDRRS